MKLETQEKMIWALFALFVVVIIAIVVAQPYFEARAYNKFTDGEKATYWDALVSELRIITK